MNTYMGDLGTYFTAGINNATNSVKRADEKSGYDLDMQDFLTLMVTELQNQSIDNTADTSEMLNQMVMMQMVSALTDMTDASIMSYAASLVGKTITVGQYDSNGVLQEIVGQVTGTGTMNGEQVVFVNDKYYHMNEIMAVGVLPKAPQKEDVPEVPELPENQEELGEIPENPEMPEIPENDPIEGDFNEDSASEFSDPAEDMSQNLANLENAVAAVASGSKELTDTNDTTEDSDAIVTETPAVDTEQQLKG